MIENSITIPNKLGLHARSASKLVSVSSGFSSKINISYQGKHVSGKSIMDLLMLAAKQGENLLVSCDGQDEEDALRAVSELITDGFGELPD